MKKSFIFTLAIGCICLLTLTSSTFAGENPWKIETEFEVIFPLGYKDYEPNTDNIKIRGNEIVGRSWLNFNGSNVFDEPINLSGAWIGDTIADAVNHFGYQEVYWGDSGSVYLGSVFICEQGEIQYKEGGQWPAPPEIPEYPSEMPDNPWFVGADGGFWLVGVQGNLNVEDSSYQTDPYYNLRFGINPLEARYPQKWLKNLKLMLGVGWHEEEAKMRISTNYGYLEGQAGIEFSEWDVTDSWHYHMCPQSRTWYNCYTLSPEYNWYAELAGGLEKAYGTLKWNLRDIYGIIGFRYRQPIDLRGESSRNWLTDMGVVARIEYWPTWRHEKLQWSGMKTKPLPISGQVVSLSEPFSETEDSFVSQGHVALGLDATVWKNPDPSAIFNGVKLGGGASLIFGETSTGDPVWGVNGNITIPLNFN